MRTGNGWTRSGRADPDEGARSARTVAAQIERAGERLTVTRAGGSASDTRQIAFLPQPILPSTLTRLQYEGVINIGAALTLDFVCAGDSAITSGDLIGPYDGAQWQVLGTPPECYAGVTLLRHAIAQRQ